MKKGLLNAKELACYIIEYYREHFAKEISPIKLQKSLYFCFAYWGGFVRKSTFNNTEITINKSEWLYDENIEAWVYGPVVPDVYFDSNIMQNKNEKLFFKNEDVKEFVDGVLDDVLCVSDFKLVEVSHSDNCWKKNFDPNSDHHNNIIDKEDIIKEYANICW